MKQEKGAQLLRLGAKRCGWQSAVFLSTLCRAFAVTSVDILLLTL